MDTLYEKAPPDPKIEDWIQKNKERFKNEYGPEKGTEILYATAWKMYDKKMDEDESFDYSEELEEAMEIWDDNYIEESMEILEIWTAALNEAEEASHEEIMKESSRFKKTLSKSFKQKGKDIVRSDTGEKVNTKTAKVDGKNVIVDADTGEILKLDESLEEAEYDDHHDDDDDDESMDEATSRKERRQKSKKMKRSSKKMARARKKKKPLTKDRVKKRARSRARSEIKKKYGSKGDSASSKDRSEKKVKRMSKKVDRLAKKKEKSVRKDRN